MPLRPSPRWRLARRVLGLATLCYLAELLLGHHYVVAAATTVLAALLLWRAHCTERWQSTPPRRLVWAADGRMFLVTPGAPPQEASVDPASLRLGSHLLLVLRCGGRRQRWLLGPDNLAAAALATLLRRLPAGGGR
ncbi:MAG: hypothetical protein ABW278_14105 [Steroidobacteraceae bacterium]